MTQEYFTEGSQKVPLNQCGFICVLSVDRQALVFLVSEKQTPLPALERDVLGGIQDWSRWGGHRGRVELKDGSSGRDGCAGCGGEAAQRGAGGGREAGGVHVDPVLPALQTLLSGAARASADSP